MPRFLPREGKVFEIYEVKKKHKIVRYATISVTVILLPVALELMSHALWEERIALKGAVYSEIRAAISIPYSLYATKK